MSALTAILAEDEAPQREALRRLLAEAWPELDVLEACEDGSAAIEALHAHRPTLAFLDIRMPGASGLDVARAAAAAGTWVVFITAYDDYAVPAFDAGAVDYLLKPVQPARLAQAVARLKERLATPTGPDMQALIEALGERLRPAGPQLIRWISASAGDSVRMLGVDEVLYFQAQDKYVKVVTADGEAVIRTPVKELVAGLDPDRFWQVHRSVVVRVDAIDRLRRDELGKYRLSLRGREETLPVSQAWLFRFRGM